MRKQLIAILFCSTVYLLAGAEVLWQTDGTNIKHAPKGSPADTWLSRKPVVAATADGGLSMDAHVTRYFKLAPEYPYLEFEISDSEIMKVGKYSSWSLGVRDPARKTYVGNVLNAQKGIYSVKVDTDVKSRRFYFYIYNQKVSFKYFRMVKVPDNYVRAELSGGKELKAGDKIKFILTLQEPCEDVTFQLFSDIGRGLRPFSLNGTNAVNLKPEDEAGRIWSAEIEFKKAAPAKTSLVFMKATILGGKISVPIWGVFPCKIN